MKRRETEDAPFSLDSFLDIVTNVVGVLVLVAIVTVISSRGISVPSGASAMRTPEPSAQRLLFECVGGQIFFVDEREIAKRLLEDAPAGSTLEQVIARLDEQDLGDETYRVYAKKIDDGVAWIYELRPGAHGERADDVGRADSAFRRRLGEGGFAYFVVHDDSFEIFGKARDIARERGVAVGWHPVEGRAPLFLAANGSLGRRIHL